uniref:Uncharacterized protein n=1 Tax=Cyprinus carpio TaxID=7962 RepID=A0A8C1WL13_CYPCA
MIEKKCAIKKEPEHKCWSEDYIKQAWEETIKQDIKSSTRRHWARVIILQVIKSFVCDMCKQNATQKNRHDTTDEQGCDMRRNPEDGSSQSKAELETVGAAGGVEQMKKSYVMLYDTAKKNAKWVYEILNKSTVPYHYKKVTFRKDNNIDDDKQALNSTKGFKDKDYVRGHLAAAANHMWCQEAYNDTYLISNMTPQIKSINNGIWKTLEYYCRNIIYNDDRVRNVHVYTGPLYLNNEGLTMEEKAVPTHYFKVVIVENVNGKAKVEYNQEKKKRENIRLKNYIVDIEEIEKKSGLPFTHKIDSNKVTSFGDKHLLND